MASTKNTQEITLSDDRQILQSYGTTVAAFIPGRGYLQTDTKFSRTTSRHITQWIGELLPYATTVPHAELISLNDPITSRQ